MESPRSPRSPGWNPQEALEALDGIPQKTWKPWMESEGQTFLNPNPKPVNPKRNEF